MNLFNLNGEVAVVGGATGVLGGALTEGLSGRERLVAIGGFLLCVAAVAALVAIVALAISIIERMAGREVSGFFGELPGELPSWLRLRQDTTHTEPRFVTTNPGKYE